MPVPRNPLPSRQSSVRIKRGLSPRLPLFLVLVVVLLCGCAQMGPPPQTIRKIAALDLETPPKFGNPPKEKRGWWFGARDVYRNPRIGTMFADILAQELGTLKYLEAYPRPGVNAYFATKRALLKKGFPGHTDAEYDVMLRKMRPADYGVELGVDEVLTGSIVDAYTSYHRTLSTWHSYVEVRLELWDVKTRREVWSEVFKSKRICLSQESTVREMAPLVTQALEKDHYRKPQ